MRSHLPTVKTRNAKRWLELTLADTEGCCLPFHSCTMGSGKARNRRFPRRKLLISGGENTRRAFHLLVGAMLTVGTLIVGNRLTSTLTDQQGWLPTLGWGALGIIVPFFYLRSQLRSGEESPEAIGTQVGRLRSELRSQVGSRSYRARSKLIAGCR